MRRSLSNSTVFSSSPAQMRCFCSISSIGAQLRWSAHILIKDGVHRTLLVNYQRTCALCLCRLLKIMKSHKISTFVPTKREKRERNLRKIVAFAPITNQRKCAYVPDCMCSTTPPISNGYIWHHKMASSYQILMKTLGNIYLYDIRWWWCKYEVLCTV